MGDEWDYVRTLDEVARTLNARVPLEETLHMIVSVAAETIPGIDHAGISTIERKGSVMTRASTDDMVLRLDELQYSLGEGPCLDALHKEDVVFVPSLRLDQRWPRYVPPAVRMGLRAQLAVKLFTDDMGTIGGLNLYSTEQESLDDDAEALAHLFATQAALALGHAHERHQLLQAVETRRVIGIAIGICMERYGLDENRAFGYLVRESSTSNIKLRDVAYRIIDQANRSHQQGSREVGATGRPFSSPVENQRVNVADGHGDT